jgi:hypothetical protein
MDESDLEETPTPPSQLEGEPPKLQITPEQRRFFGGGRSFHQQPALENKVRVPKATRRRE